MNGIAFSDVDEIWWLETIGGHHWIAKRVPDDAYVTMPNQLGIDYFDLADAEGDQVEHMASADLRSWMRAHHLDLTLPKLDAFDEFYDDLVDADGGEAGDGADQNLLDMLETCVRACSPATSSTRARRSGATPTPTMCTTRRAPGTCSAA